MWLISPVLELAKGVLGWMTKKEDVNLEKYKVDGQVSMNAVNAEVEIVKAGKDIKRDRWMQWGFVAPTVVFYNALIIDCIGQRYFEWDYDVLALPDPWNYVPMSIVAFLFVQKIVRR